jgi:mono/diheme cytochrome c family protein
MTYLKWAGISLVSIIVIALGALYGLTELRFRRTYTVPDYAITLTRDSATVARGKHIATTRGCVDCHGANLGGQTFIDEPILASLYASNLTSGDGGIGSTFTPADWERAIRHGVGPDGLPLHFMPSHEFYPLSDEDLSALVSYIQSLPPVAGQKPANEVGPLGRFLVATRIMPNYLPAELIDHAAARPVAPLAGRSAEYGAYLATGCTGCHGDGLSGGPIPGAPPEFLAPANITPHATGIADWTEEDFLRLMREGLRPDGSQVDPQMPWQGLGQMTDEELGAIWLHLRSVEPREYGTR